jgi:hypothetical protein
MELRELRIGSTVLALVAVGLLLYAIYGDPERAYFMVLRWVTVAACLSCGYTLFRISRAWFAVSGLLVIVAGVEGFAELLREEWLPINWAGVALLGFSVLAIALPQATQSYRARQKYPWWTRKNFVYAALFLALVAISAISSYQNFEATGKLMDEKEKLLREKDDVTTRAADEKRKLREEILTLERERASLQEKLLDERMGRIIAEARRKQPSSQETWTIGSTMDEVRRLQGTPTDIFTIGDRTTWMYSYSNVRFEDSRVIGYSNLANNLKVR